MVMLFQDFSVNRRDFILIIIFVLKLKNGPSIYAFLDIDAVLIPSPKIQALHFFQIKFQKDNLVYVLGYVNDYLCSQVKYITRWLSTWFSARKMKEFPPQFSLAFVSINITKMGIPTWFSRKMCSELLRLSLPSLLPLTFLPSSFFFSFTCPSLPLYSLLLFSPFPLILPFFFFPCSLLTSLSFPFSLLTSLSFPFSLSPPFIFPSSVPSSFFPSLFLPLSFLSSLLFLLLLFPSFSSHYFSNT